MTKGKKGSKGQRRDDQERKRDERSRKNAIRKEEKNKYSLENDENFASFSNQLEAQGLKTKQIIGDGNCLFRALGDQLDGDQNTHARHRQEIVQFIRSHRQDFEPFMEDNISFEKHLQELSKLGNFGGNDAIVAFARNHGVDVVIHQLNEPRWVISGSEYAKTGQVIELHISYHNGEHYSSVRSLFDGSASDPAWPHFRDRGLSSMGKKPEGVDKKGKKTKETKQKWVSRGAEGFSASAAEHNDSETVAEKAVMEATGCKDLVLVAQTLQENMYNVDLSISYVLQMMCVAEEQGFATSELCFNVDQKEAAHTEQTMESDSTHSCCSANKDNSSTCILNTDTTNHVEYTTTEESSESQNNTGDNVKSSVMEESSELCLDVRTTDSKEQNVLNKTDTSISGDSPVALHSPQGARPKVVTSKPRAGQNINTHLSNKKRKQLAKQEKKKNREERRKLGGEATVSECTSVTNESIMPDLGALAI